MPLNATNKLAYVSDLAADPNYTTDIDGQSTTNYAYDEIGNLVSDASEQIAKIDWYASGKIRSIERTSTSVKPDLEFIYDATGNRVVKIVKPRNGSGVRSQLHWTYTFYVRDAQGNVLAVYEKTFAQVSGSTYNDQTSLAELDIYGSKRLGLLYDGSSYSRTFTDASFVDANGALFTPTYSSHSGTTPCTGNCVNSYQRKLGKKAYEVINHLGNVLETVSGRKLVVDDYSYAAWTSGTKYAYDAVRNTYYESVSGTFQRVTASSDNKADYYRADVRSYSDYYAFGAQMDGRMDNSNVYRYNFNGKETDSENGNDLDFGARIYDARLGRFLSVDPLTGKYPFLTPYCYAANSPVRLIDAEGKGPSDGFPEYAKAGDIYITKTDEGIQAPNGSFLTGTDGTGWCTGASTDLAMYMYRMATDGNWYTVGFQTAGGASYFWDNTAKWFVDSKTGEEFDDHFTMDIANGIGAMMTPLVNMAIKGANGQDPFDDIKKDFANYDGNFLSYAGSRFLGGIEAWVDDVSYGGHRRTQALWSFWAGTAMFGPPVGLGSELFYRGTIAGEFKAGLYPRLGGSAPFVNYYTLAAMDAGYSTALNGARMRAGLFVQMNHGMAAIMEGRMPTLLFSNSAATIMGRSWQNFSIGAGVGLFSYSTIGASSLIGLDAGIRARGVH